MGCGGRTGEAGVSGRSGSVGTGEGQGGRRGRDGSGMVGQNYFRCLGMCWCMGIFTGRLVGQAGSGIYNPFWYV